jgi:threonine dehydratase
MKSETGQIIFPNVDNIFQAAERLRKVAIHTPLQPNLNLSERFEANIFLKREDLQIVRSYKIRGAYNKMAQLPKESIEKGVVCASAGNHAQGVVYADDDAESKSKTGQNVR